MPLLKPKCASGRFHCVIGYMRRFHLLIQMNHLHNAADRAQKSPPYLHRKAFKQHTKEQNFY